MRTYYLATTATYSIRISGLAYKVLACLQMMAGYQTRACWPKYNTIAARCGCSRRSAMRAVKELCLAGLLEKRRQFEQRRDSEGRRQKENLYTLVDCPQITLQQAAASSAGAHPCNSEKALKAPVHIQKANIADVSRLTGSALRVYNYLTLRAGSKFTCWLSKSELARACNISVSTVFRAIKRLVCLGVLSVQTQTRNDIDGSNGSACNRYTILSYRNCNLPCRRLSRLAKLRLIAAFLLNRPLRFTPHVIPARNAIVTPGDTNPVTPRTITLKNNIEKEKPKSQSILRWIGRRFFKFSDFFLFARFFKSTVKDKCVALQNSFFDFQTFFHFDH